MKYFIKTFGCQMNESDSERIASFMDSYGFEEAKDIKKANLVIFNTCGVRQTAEDRVYGQVHNLRKNNPPQSPLRIKEGKLGVPVIVITGCLAHRKDVQRKLQDKVDLFIETKDFSKIKNLNLFKNQKLKNKNSIEEYLDIIPKYQKSTSAFIPIMTGCNNFCSYCVVPYARGREWSRPAEDIIEEIEKLSKKGYTEVTLLGQNVNSYVYNVKSQKSKVKFATKNSKLKNRKLIENFKFQIENFDDKITFPVLINFLATSFPRISFNFLTSHPKDFSEELISVIRENKNISQKIHLPIQSGSNKVLKDMNRPYTKQHYLSLIKKIRENIPAAEISTDVIVGFPTETQKDFEETIDIFKKVGYSEAFINKYSPRPETAALKLGDPIPWNEKKRREKILRELL